jgi:hypothetical protein
MGRHVKMGWLKRRLKDIGRKPIDLARFLGLPPARAYEMLKGERYIQPNEIDRVARFLDWPATDVVAHMGGRDPRGLPVLAEPAPKLRCSFCDKCQDDVLQLIAGPRNVFICDECVDLCSDIIDEATLLAEVRRLGT